MSKQVKYINKPYVVYNRDTDLVNKKPEFKPGKTPYCLLGDEILNGEVNWLQVLGEVLATGQFTLSAISETLDIEVKVLTLVLDNDLRLLNFKAGTKLLALHEKVVVGPTIADSVI